MIWLAIILIILSILLTTITIFLVRKMIQFMLMFDELMARFIEQVQEFYEAQKRLFKNLEDQSMKFNKNLHDLEALKRTINTLSSVSDILHESTKNVRIETGNLASKIKHNQHVPQPKKNPFNEKQIISTIMKEIDKKKKE